MPSEGERPCDVHALVDGDTDPRDVRYCPGCGAWMCEDCRLSPARRAKAWAKRKMQRWRIGA